MPAEIHELTASDLDAADRVTRLAFGTFLGAPTPERFWGDAEWVRPRWHSASSAGVMAKVDAAVVGSSFANRWGSVGFVGPVAVHPDHWGHSLATDLLNATMELFARWGVEQVGLFTFADSPKHVGLYERFGFWPRSLTAVMRSRVEDTHPAPGSLFSALAPEQRNSALASARALTDAIHPGLDLTGEIDSIATNSLGDTVLIDDEAGLAGLAVCHIGAGTEAGTGHCYIKFAGVRPGHRARERFVQLIAASRLLAAHHQAEWLLAGVNAAREEAWRTLRSLGFTTQLQGVSMHRPNLPFYSTPHALVIDDWR